MSPPHQFAYPSIVKSAVRFWRKGYAYRVVTGMGEADCDIGSNLYPHHSNSSRARVVAPQVARLGNPLVRASLRRAAQLPARSHGSMIQINAAARQPPKWRMPFDPGRASNTEVAGIGLRLYQAVGS